MSTPRPGRLLRPTYSAAHALPKRAAATARLPSDLLWTFMCRRRLALRANPRPHILQTSVLTLECVERCCCNAPACVKRVPHSSHLTGKCYTMMKHMHSRHQRVGGVHHGLRNIVGFTTITEHPLRILPLTKAELNERQLWHLHVASSTRHKKIC